MQPGCDLTSLAGLVPNSSYPWNPEAVSINNSGAVARVHYHSFLAGAGSSCGGALAVG
jgi:hypothetical protein